MFTRICSVVSGLSFLLGLTLLATPAAMIAAPTITSSASLRVNQGIAIAYQITASGSPITFNVPAAERTGTSASRAFVSKNVARRRSA